MYDFFGTEYGRAGWFSYVILWLRMAFGVHALVSGVNYFYPFLPLPVGTSPIGPFIGEMIATGMYDGIKIIEILVGICLILNRFVPLALILEFPISYSIFHLSVFVDGGDRQMFTGPRELFYNGFLMVVYAGYYVQMLKMNASSAPLWKWTENVKGKF